MFHIALFEPQIAPNTGNIIRLCANNGCHLHLIEPLGFNFEEKKLRRAGLDYHDLAKVTIYSDFIDFKNKLSAHRIIACTTKSSQSHSQFNYQAEDVLLFGSETHGLAKDVLADINENFTVRIPMLENNRSMNLSNAVAIISYEAWRQHQFSGGF